MIDTLYDEKMAGSLHLTPAAPPLTAPRPPSTGTLSRAISPSLRPGVLAAPSFGSLTLRRGAPARPPLPPRRERNCVEHHRRCPPGSIRNESRCCRLIGSSNEYPRGDRFQILQPFGIIR
jgi:hypothetical protein